MCGNDPLWVPYNGGCAFLDADKFENIEIVARYEDPGDKPAAVIKTNFGQGTVVLSGVHW